MAGNYNVFVKLLICYKDGSRTFNPVKVIYVEVQLILLYIYNFSNFDFCTTKHYIQIKNGIQSIFFPIFSVIAGSR